MTSESEGATVREYAATIWVDDSDKPGERVRVIAENLDEARKKLEAEYGEGHIFDLRNEEDAARPR